MTANSNAHGQPKDPLRSIPVEQFIELAASGVDVLDVRGGPEYALSHLRGSIFIGLSQMFPKWVQSLLDPSRALMVIADPGQEAVVMPCLVEVGCSAVHGFLEGGFASIAGRGELLAGTERIDHIGLASELEASDAPYLLDVRQPQEWQRGRIATAPNLPLTEFEGRVAEVPTDCRVILQCQGGYRSLIAASFLERAGHNSTVDMAGGFGAWAQAGLPIQPCS
ncbi:MAG: hydroxyacylglutathione hydrolase [Planctomycetota bacterium]|jgi:hydroxyacylglutathione hydrolase